MMPRGNLFERRATWRNAHFCRGYLPRLTKRAQGHPGIEVVESAMNKNEAEVLSFQLGKEEYAISILKVQEIRGYESVARIANAPAYVKGVLNLRGIIVPIVDMRIKFGLGEPTYDQFTVVIILNIGHRVIGMVVDSVSDVVTLAPDQIRPAPAMGTSVDTSYLQGIGTNGERMLILVDIDKLMRSDEIGLIETLREAA
jgi:purine-binding chemotaxis protein CheW